MMRLTASSVSWLFFCLLFSFSAADNSVDVTITNCSPTGSHAENVEFSYEPTPAQVGEKLTLKGQAKYTIQDKAPTYQLTAHYGFLKLVDHTDTLCNPTSVDMPLGIGTMEISGIQCPLVANQEIELSATIPSSGTSLPGQAKARLLAISSTTGQTELCVDIVIDVSLDDEKTKEQQQQQQILQMMSMMEDNNTKDQNNNNLRGTTTSNQLEHTN